jgi:hypothetical protein
MAYLQFDKISILIIKGVNYLSRQSVYGAPILGKKVKRALKELADQDQDV